MNNKVSNIPKERLIAIQLFELERLAGYQRQLQISWKKKKTCKCVSSLERGELPWCKHIKNSFRIEFKSQETKIWNRALDIGRLLAHNKVIDKLFHRL